jgi:predicted transposase YbfD/YdcC
MLDKMAKMVIGQRCVDGKSNEITAIPLLLATLASEGTVVTMDAMGTLNRSGFSRQKSRLSFGSR